MKTTEIQIPEPCAIPWDSMEGGKQKRFCSQCTKNVVDISTMTERQARAFLTENPGHCIQMDVLGETILFEAPKRESATFKRPGPFLRRAVKAGALFGLGLATPAFASGDAQSSSGSLVEWLASFVWDEEDSAETDSKPEAEPTESSLIPELDDARPETVKPPIPLHHPIKRLGGAPVQVRGDPVRVAPPKKR